MATTGIWNFFYVGTWAYAQLRFEFAYLNDKGLRASAFIAASKSYVATADNHQSETPGWRGAEFDGKWHHVAVTMEEVTGDGGDVRTRVTSYFDYKTHDQKEVSGRLYATGESGLMMQESNGSGGRLSTWDIDEVRITGRILDVSEFCRKISAGAVIRLK
jgi:hypothetical protein